MKLELKHLTPYLPYGLKLRCKREGYGKYWTEQLTRLYFSPTRDELDVTTVNSILSKDEYKPILVPLPKDISPTGYYRYEEWCSFFEKHLDVFGLIEKGLAIDINDIKSEEKNL